MGNQQTKSDKNSLLNSEETIFVDNSFKSLTTNHDKLKPDALLKSWSNLVDPEFLSFTKESLFGKTETITIKQYIEHYYVVTKGSLYEKSNYINSRIFGNPPGVEGGITPENLLKFVSSVVRSYFIVLDHNKTQEYTSWLNRNVLVNRKDIDNYSQYLLKDLINVQPISMDELENWLHFNPLWLQMWKAIVVFLISQKSVHIPSTAECQPKTLPLCELPPNCNQLKSILDVGKIMFLNDQLPTDFRSKWRLLFNSQIHGESFATFLGKILNKGPTVLIIEDEQKYIFGGFAPHSWNLNPKFVGNDTALLFTLQPTMQSFITSGYNDHYQYLNTSQQTMPNGLGMGGQFEYWGLWLDCEYGLGQSSETCTTFKNYKQLSGQKSFNIRNIEVWGVGEEPEKDDAEGPQRSILDKNLEDKVILDLAGRQMHSEGLRDPDLEE
ncbi:MTOR-associated protein MEAK7 [Episyrphus balteatus]|uniref:MTOR-associated protein MEAK7 n=1 Tax=Episyrphus balteatus TaxID=286459 RepID=UPI0024856CDB|nr:MTOR-associated protein MEAK7 [Episyrphus balteatus]